MKKNEYIEHLAKMSERELKGQAKPKGDKQGKGGGVSPFPENLDEALRRIKRNARPA